jgi:phosphatidylglycerophosphate synthase
MGWTCMHEKVVNVANALSASRLLCLPVLVFFVLADWRTPS